MISNNNIIDNEEFNISNYLHNKTSDFDKVTAAMNWSIDANATIIIPTANLIDLENRWINFNSMIKKKRRESDWKSLELFGMTNQEHYDKLHAEILKNDIENDIDKKISPVSESYVEMEDSYYAPDAINYTSLDVEKAREWAKDSDRIIILPTRTLAELEELWDSYNMMIKKHRRESDWMSTNIFGITNLRHYEYLKNQFLKEDISKEDKEAYGSVIESVNMIKFKRYYGQAINESIPDTVKSLTEMVVRSNGVYEDAITSNIVSDVLDKYDSDIIAPSDIVDTIICGDMPYIDPNEMIDKGVFGQTPAENYYGVLADNSMLTDKFSVKEWFDLYKSIDKGLYTEFGNYASEWVNKVRDLLYELNLMKDRWTDDRIRARKQSLLELGWDPDIEFSNKARKIAREMASFRMRSNFSGKSFKVINLKEFKSLNSLESINESSTSLKPVYVVMIEGKSYFSKVIRTFTKDIYSHVAISLDPELHDMYSYGININEHSDRKGFRKEDISDLPVGGRIGVFAFFVSDNVYKKIVAFIDSFKENAEKTSYSFTNLVTYLFNIPYNTEWKLVCSQFVDRCLQAAGINLTGRDSSQVSPADLNKSLTEGNRIYNLYEGIHSKYDAKAISRLVSALSRKAKPLKESYANYYINENMYIAGVLGNINNIDALMEMKDHVSIVENSLTRKLLENVIFDSISIRPLGEAKEFPIQFDKDGNLLIKNLKKIDYEAEYAKSHKLLKEYDNSKNYEGIKYELSKLWMMMCMIEDKLHSKKFQDLPSFAIETSTAHKARAKIINDFKYYLEKVMKEEPKFNFTEYYDQSPFSSATTKINSSTLSFMGKMIVKFIKSL